MEGNKDQTSVEEIRKEYKSKALVEAEMPESPFAQFTEWFEEARKADMYEPNAMCLSTCGADLKPSSRFVLLKAYDDRGFVWYTNYESRKSGQLTENPNAALTFWWGNLDRSVRIEGSVEKVSGEESDAYF